MVPGRLRTALSRGDQLNVIAECKRRSPSRGVLRPSYDPVAIARSFSAILAFWSATPCNCLRPASLRARLRT